MSSVKQYCPSAYSTHCKQPKIHMKQESIHEIASLFGDSLIKNKLSYAAEFSAI